MLELTKDELVLILSSLALTIKQIKESPDKEKLTEELQTLEKLYERIRKMPETYKARIN